jgi:hypothetical protein
LEEGLEDVVFFLMGEFGKTVGFEVVPFGEVGDAVLDVLEVFICFVELILDFLFRRGVCFDLGFRIRVLWLDEEVLHFGVVDFFEHHSVVSDAGDFFHA